MTPPHHSPLVHRNGGRKLVLGAAGFLGINLVDALLSVGITPVCGRRKRTNVLALRKRKCPMVIADLDDVDGLVEAMAGCDVVFHAAAHYPRLCVDHDATLALGIRQTQNALDAAARAGIKRFVYVGTTATVAPAHGRFSNESDTWTSPPEHGLYHDLKWHMEQLVLAEDRFETTIALPSGCVGPWDLRVGTSAIIVALARGMNPPHPDGIVPLVDARDVGLALVAMGLHQSPPRRLILSGHNRGLHDLLVALADRYRVAPPSRPLSAEAAVLLADQEELRAASEGGRAALSREIVDLVVNGVPLDASLSERVLGIRYRPLRDTLDAYDAWARSLRIIPHLPMEPEIHP